MDANSKELLPHEEFKAVCVNLLVTEDFFFKNLVQRNFKVPYNQFVDFVRQLSEADLYELFIDTRIHDNWYSAYIQHKAIELEYEFSLEGVHEIEDYFRDNLAYPPFVQKFQIDLENYRLTGYDDAGSN